MHFNVIEDNYYNDILQKLKKFVPDFHFEDDEPFLVMFEFSQYIIENINSSPIITNCFAFINDAISNGGSKTEDIIVLQIFQNIYSNKTYVDISKEFLDEKSLILFLKSYDEYLKDYDQSE